MAIMRLLIIAGLLAIIALASYSANAEAGLKKDIVTKALDTGEAKEFLGRHPDSKAYLTSMPSGGLSKALSGMDVFFKRYEGDPLVQAAGNKTSRFKDSPTIHIVSVSPNAPVKKEGWIAPHPEKPVLFLFFSGNGLLYAQEKT